MKRYLSSGSHLTVTNYVMTIFSILASIVSHHFSLKVNKGAILETDCKINEDSPNSQF